MENNLSVVKENFKELPNNIEAEQAVIGSVLTSNEIFDDLSSIISENNFFDPLHQKIYAAINNLIYKGMLANPITLKSYFESEKDDLNVPEYLIKIIYFVAMQLYLKQLKLKEQLIHHKLCCYEVFQTILAKQELELIQPPTTKAMKLQLKLYILDQWQLNK